MKTGMLAAEAVFEGLSGGQQSEVLRDYERSVRGSWVHEELWRARNFGPAQHKFGLLGGSAFTWLDQNLFRGRLPFTLHNRLPDHASLRPAARSRRIEYPKPDGKLSFDRLSSVYLSATNHEEDQPCHLTLADPAIPIRDNLPRFDEPAQRYCPAAVYEVAHEGGRTTFRDQRAQLHSLQDLRHQGSRAEHQLDHAGGRRRPQLRGYVIQLFSRLPARLQIHRRHRPQATSTATATASPPPMQRAATPRPPPRARSA